MAENISEEKLQGFANLIHGTTDEELKALLSLANDENRSRLERIDRLKVLTFRPGETVKNLKGSRRLQLGLQGKVIRVANTTILVNFGEAGTWRMPATLIDKE